MGIQSVITAFLFMITRPTEETPNIERLTDAYTDTDFLLVSEII